jgi:GT2 family glycosyltransferase
MRGRPPAISAVVPAFNRADVIVATIDSLLAQRLPFSEIVVVNDGSTDATADVIASYGDRVRLVSTPNRGVQHARNLGVSLATADWITFCDSDDLLSEALTEVLAEFIRAHAEYHLLYCNFTTFVQDKESGDKFSQAPAAYFEGSKRIGDFVCDVPHLFARMLQFQPLFMSGVTIRRDLFTRIGGFDERLRGVKAEDWEFTLRAVAATRTALCVKPLARVRKHLGNDSADSLLMKLGEIEILQYALNHHPGAKGYAAAIHESIDARRIDAFNSAFARGDFALALDLLCRLNKLPSDMKSRLKHWILHLPGPLRRILWRATQA